MQDSKRMVRGGALVGVLLSAAVGFTGCGSSSGGGPAAGGTRITGTASAPSTQVARAGGLNTRALVQAFRIGSPAEAGAVVARRAVANAAVQAAVLGGSTPLVTTTTDADGHFVIQVTGLPTGTPIVITVRGQGPAGPIRLRAVARVGDSTPADVDEASTVGADAAEATAAEGADDDTVVETAEAVEGQQEAAETEDPAEVPDLQDTEQARETVREKAHQHLVGNFGVKVGAVLTGQPPRRQAMQALMAAQVYAHRALGLPVALHLGEAQAVALVTLFQAGQPFTAAQVKDALTAAGVKAGDNDLTDADVTAALAALKARPVLATALADVSETQIPPTVALLLGEQVNDTSVLFSITTQEQLNAFVNALVGTPVAGPDQEEAEEPEAPAEQTAA